MNAIPLYEAKNKLPLFMHQAESLGPVFISRRNKTVGVLLSFEEYKKLTASKKTECFKNTSQHKAFSAIQEISELKIENWFE